MHRCMQEKENQKVEVDTGLCPYWQMAKAEILAKQTDMNKQNLL